MTRRARSSPLAQHPHGLDADILLGSLLDGGEADPGGRAA